MLGREEGAEAAAGGGLGLAEEEGDWALKEVGKMERPGQGAGEQAGFGDLSAAGGQAAVGGGLGGQAAMGVAAGGLTAPCGWASALAGVIPAKAKERTSRLSCGRCT